MKLLLLWSIVASILNSTYAGCPFAPSYANGQQRSVAINQTKYELIDDNFVIVMGEPGFVPWSSENFLPKTIQWYYDTNTLLVAQQFYIEKYTSMNLNKHLTNKEKLAVLESITDSVPINLRCKPVPICDKNELYSRITGECNNIENPKWASTLTPFGRMLPAVYDDGIYTVRKSVTNEALPSPRIIGNLALQHSTYNPPPSAIINFASLSMGQVIVGDTGRRDIYQNDYDGTNGLKCCSADYRHMLPDQLSYYGCYPIEVPADDPYYSQYKFGCAHNIRSQPIFSNDCKLGSADISNSVTHILDLSIIYGSHLDMLQTVRAFTSGKMLTSKNDFLPIESDCTGDFCYFTGDPRTVVLPTLGIFPLVYIRYHNYIAEQLSEINEHWDDERLFQETRRILIALNQNFIFNEWLPSILGIELAQKRDVTCAQSTTYCGTYNSKVDPSTLNEFAVAAFRIFHNNVPENVNFYNSDYKLVNSIVFSDSGSGMEILQTKAVELMRGLLIDPLLLGRYPDNMRNTVLNYGNSKGIGVDVASLDILRGRDHGIAPYHVYLDKISTGKKNGIQEWSDYNGPLSYYSIQRLQKVYKHPHDVDLLVGLLLEEKVGAYAGIVGLYILEEQFYRLKFGNRFHYSFKDNPNPFTPEQILEINKQTFGSILCKTLDIEEVLANSFLVKSPTNAFVKCKGKSFKDLDLSLWKEKKQD